MLLTLQLIDKKVKISVLERRFIFQSWHTGVGRDPAVLPPRVAWVLSNSLTQFSAGGACYNVHFLGQVWRDERAL